MFCYWAIYNAARHIYFLNPMIYFPLILCGAEKIFKGKSPWPFVWAVVIAAVSNFYFFYMQVILTVVYVIVRMLPLLRREWKPALRRLLRLTGFAVLSALLSAAVLLPIMNAFLGSDRMSTQAAGLFFYPLSYYSRLPGLLLSTTDYYWLCLGLSAIVLPAVLLLFIRKKQHRTVKAFFLIGLVIILCPSLGQALNGFSYISNRWCWAFVLVCACIVTVMWPELLTLSGREAVLLAAATAGYLLLCLLADYSRGAEAFANIALALVVICIIVLYSAEIVGMRAFTAQSMLIVISGISIVSHGYWTNAYSAGNYASESMSIEELTETNLQREAMAVAEISEEETDEFFRYSGLSLTKNAGTNAGLSSTSSYWSITNAYAAEYREHLELLDNSS